jgi:hypothetical protein
VTSCELNLWEAVVLQALDDLAGSKLARSDQGLTRNQDAARSWFFSDADYLGSFIFCCQHLGIDPGAVRRGLRSRTAAEIGQSLKKYRNNSTLVHRYVDSLDNPAFDCTSGRWFVAGSVSR